MEHMIRLESGRWYARLEVDAQGREYSHLSRADRPEETMRVRLPFGWRDLDDDEIRTLSRKPEVRIWYDEHGIRWRIAAVGPGTSYEFPIPGRYLVFDSDQAWAGLTRYEEGRELGELTDEELQSLRDDISDLGGGRRSFRPPQDSATP
jgi:hypothetical protein